MDNEQIEFNVNYYMCKRRLFHSYYMYIDTKDCLIDQILVNNNTDGLIIKTLEHPKSPFVIGMIRCRNKDCDTYEDIVFNQLDHKLLFKYGDRYDKFALALINASVKTYERGSVNLVDLVNSVTDI